MSIPIDDQPCEGDAEPREQGAGVVGLVGRSSSAYLLIIVSREVVNLRSSHIQQGKSDEHQHRIINKQGGLLNKSKLYIGKQRNYKPEKS